jgi:hypothetical protein
MIYISHLQKAKTGPSGGAYVKNMRSMRKTSGVREYHIARAQREQENFFPQPSHHQDKGERHVPPHESVHEMPQGNGKVLTTTSQKTEKPRPQPTGAFSICSC